MKEQSPKTKEQVLASVVRSFSIYEVQQIRIGSHRYPRRRISLQHVGFFDSKQHAEEAMHTYIDLLKDQAKQRGKEQDYYADCFGFFIMERLVHNKFSTFYEKDLPCQCCSYTADGELNDCVALDEFGWYRGRKNEDIRFKVGDIVEVVDEDFADLAIVGGLPLTTERYRQIKVNGECPSHFLDESDDCYLVYPLWGEEGTHYHPANYKVFRPTKPVTEKMAAELKERLERQ